MHKLTEYIVKRYINDSGQINNPEVRASYGALEAWASIIVNILLFVVKLVLGIMINSMSVLADAVHTLSDTGSSLVILTGFRMAQKPSDREHPFGHGRAELIAGLIVAVVLIVAGIELLHGSVVRIWHPQIAAGRADWWVIAALLVTVAIKEIMARFSRELGHKIKSQALQADFWHHRSDAISTLLVIAALICTRWGYLYVDGIAGLGVSLIVIYSGYVIARDTISPLLGERPSGELLDKIEYICRSIDGVLGVHDVIVHHYGQTHLASLHIEVADSSSAVELHDLSEKVEAVIENKLGISTVVHIDPINKNHPRYAEIRHTIEQITGQDNRIAGFHELRLTEGHDRQGKLYAIFDITITDNARDEETTELKREIYSKLATRLPDVNFSIKIEPRYAYTGN